MNNKNKIITLGFATALMSTSALAGGLERGTWSPSMLYEEGNYIEGSWARVNPSVTSEPVAALGGAILDVAPSYNQLGFGIKLDLSDMLAIGLTYYQPTGYSLAYPAPLSTTADLESTAIALVAKYQATENFSVYGGINYVSVEGSAYQLNSTTLAGRELRFEKDSDIGYIVGAAFEKKEIALRMSLTYESGTEHSLATGLGVLGGPYAPVGDSVGGTPSAITLHAQSGIAEGTLLFGSIRYAMHSDADVLLPAALGSANLTGFSNSTTYSLGVGKKLSDTLSVSVSGTYEKGTGEPNTLNPTDGKKTLSVGAKYAISENVDWSVGASYTWLGDNVTEPLPVGIVAFSGNNAVAFGTKIGISF